MDIKPKKVCQRMSQSYCSFFLLFKVLSIAFMDLLISSKTTAVVLGNNPAYAIQGKNIFPSRKQIPWKYVCCRIMPVSNSTFLLDATDIVALLFLSAISVIMHFSHVQVLVWMLIEKSKNIKTPS